MTNRRFNLTRTVCFFATLCAIFSVSDLCRAAMMPHFTAQIFDLKDHTKQMFDYKSEYEIVGTSKIYYNTIKDMQGEVVVLEKTVMSLDGDKERLVSFEQDQKQLGTVGKLEVRDGKAYFTFLKDGKTKSDDEKFTDDFIVTSTLVPRLQAHWAEILKGETVKARLAVLDRQETVGFQFKKERDQEINGAPGVIIKMKPSSVIISALVNPLLFGFTADGAKLLQLEGRTSAKVKVDGHFKDFDGFTVYTHPLPIIATPGAEAPKADTEKTSPVPVKKVPKVKSKK